MVKEIGRGSRENVGEVYKSVENLESVVNCVLLTALFGLKIGSFQLSLIVETR